MIGSFQTKRVTSRSWVGNLGVGVNSPQEALDIRGNMHFNRVSNVSSVSVDSNVVTEYTGPHDRPLREYPEITVTTATTGGYTVSASSNLTGKNPWKAFNPSDYWRSLNGYSTSDPYGYTGDEDITDTNGTLHEGEWLQLELPNKINISRVTFAFHSSGSFQLTSYVILGSNNDTSWTLIHTNENLSPGLSPSYLSEDNFTTVGYFKYIKLLVKTINGSAQSVLISRLRYYGHEEGSGSLDTTLKSVYNVPATTGTQLEVYYDGQDYSVMPTVGSASVTDKAGGDQTGTPSSGVSFDSTYKAFAFDGTTNGKIVGTHNLSGTSPTHTISIWFKRTVVVGSHDYVVAVGTSTTAQNSAILINNDLIVFSIFGDSVIGSSKIVNDIWYHLTVTYNGGIWNSTNCKMYLNGGLISTTTGGGGTFNLTGAQFTLGTNSVGAAQGVLAFNGSIANFRLYSKALNADQVRELYDYQKDYFLGSKSQVTLYKGHLGIGVAEPSGQLELAGDERIQEYPPGPMSGYKTHIPGHGEFQAYASTEFNTTMSVDKIFNKILLLNTDDRWRTSSAMYTATAGGSPARTDRAKLASNTPHGQWVVLKLPYKTCLKQYNWVGLTTQDPKEGQIWGSNDGHSWSHVNSFINGGDAWVAAGSDTSDSAAGITNRRIVTGNTTYYSYYAMIITMIQAQDDAVTIRELKFFGTPGPTTLDKGSLSLTRSLDVPRISRYDVDTETPRPEKLVVDFDTTVNSSPTDISGQGNHGTLVGATYSAPDKAFNFDASTEYIDSTLNNTGDTDISVSLWLKREADTTGTVWMIGNPTQTNGQNLGFDIYLASSNHIYLWTPNGPTLLDTDGALQFPVGQWVHLVCTRTGATLKVYIDGVDWTPNMTYGTAASGLALPANSKFRLGLRMAANVEFTGKISNSKVYNVVLEASEVQKLYRLGRTGRSMVISDTAVGIGKAPEAQLDVRGSGGFTGDLTVGGNMNNYQYWFRGNRNGQNTNGATTGSLLVIQYESIAGSYTSAWTGSNAYNCPVAGVYMVHGSLMCFSNAGEAGYLWIEVRRYNSAGAQLDAGSANDMHTPYRDNTYQSYHFQQTHLCNKGDRMQIIYRGSNANAHLDLHSSWGPLSIYKIG